MVYSYFPFSFLQISFANNLFFFLQCLVLTLYMNFKGYFNINLIKIGISMLETVVELYIRKKKENNYIRKIKIRKKMQFLFCSIKRPTKAATVNREKGMKDVYHFWLSPKKCILQFLGIQSVNIRKKNIYSIKNSYKTVLTLFY